MKKTLSAILIVLMLHPGISSALDMYALPEVREQAKAGLHQTYCSRGERFQTDIPIIVPDADKMPVLQIEACSDEPDLQALRKWVGSDPVTEPALDKGYVKAFYRPNPVLPKGINGWQVQRYAGEIEESEALDGDFGKTFGEAWREAKQASQIVFGKDFDVTFTSICQRTRWREYQTGAKRDKWGDFVSVEKRIYEKDGYLYAQGYGETVLFGAQVLRGIPLLAHTSDGLWYELDETGGIAVTATKKAVSRVIAEDVPLCGVERRP